MPGLLLPQSPRIIRAAHEFPRNLPVRADPRWGLHVVQPYQQSLPVGTGLIEGDPTPDWGWEPPVIVPPLPDPFSSSSEESSSQSSSQQSSSFPSSSSTPPSSSSLEISSTITAAPSCCRDNVESATYTFSFSGGSNAGCTSGCSTPFNTQFKVTYRAGTSDWRSAQFVSCSYTGGNTWHWIMSMSCQSLVPPHPASDHNRVTLQCQANSGITAAMVVYRTDFPMPHNCLLPFQLAKFNEPGIHCTGFPGTITLIPN